MNLHAERHTTLSALMGARVLASDGAVVGRISEAIVEAGTGSTHVSRLIIRQTSGARTSVRPEYLQERVAGAHQLRLLPAWTLQPYAPAADSVQLAYDLLDQQIIDVAGHKVVRVNDVDLVWESCADGTGCALRLAEVEVGLRGAVRRILKGMPLDLVDRIARQFAPRVIPWEFVDLIDRDPARRVRLKVAGDRLSHMHPSDLADILEELAPAERDAVFTSLDEEVAAEALEEVDPRLQRSLLEGLESSRAADIIEEMDPAAAADLLNELSDERSDAILQQMEPAERQDVEDLLNVDEHTAAASMTTDFVALPETATVSNAIDAIRSFEGDIDTLSEVYLLRGDKLAGVVNLSRILLAEGSAPLASVRERRVRSCERDSRTALVAELFDKYNLRSLPVVDPETDAEHRAHTGTLVGVIHAEHVIALLRERR